MNILITAGGTREDIDAVRGITNYATGRLGSLIADEFLLNTPKARVTYVCGEDSVLPQTPVAELVRIKCAQGLMDAVENLLTIRDYYAVIHSMAVSDYTPLRVTDIHGAPLDSHHKISSDMAEILVYLKQTPKIIGRIKVLQPSTILVGFKLLMDAPEIELIEAAQRLMEKNGCSYVLANDLSHIKGDLHKALFLDAGGVIARMNTKQEIAQCICNALTKGQ
jgi:phosphopantothenate-cysteine ligase